MAGHTRSPRKPEFTFPLEPNVSNVFLNLELNQSNQGLRCEGHEPLYVTFFSANGKTLCHKQMSKSTLCIQMGREVYPLCVSLSFIVYFLLLCN